ncbi:uncharacterized protein LOC107304210 [Oryza brachyantha]|uniref:uncharacterized protein LOC107304210 n=1 Tax=Oryza brachyantha TaxID=4533 RepID=UPI000776224B|nr:uncharacterized protein LOC107304210 [Oryza brachyantha]
MLFEREGTSSYNSECPQEALQAVSTLIFTAARFPDLPELCDLRHVLTERYGSFVDPFVSSEFVQKLQNKSSTNEQKLQVMQRIAEEFSVLFNANALEHWNNRYLVYLKIDMIIKTRVLLNVYKLKNQHVMS